MHINIPNIIQLVGFDHETLNACGHFTLGTLAMAQNLILGHIF